MGRHLSPAPGEGNGQDYGQVGVFKGKALADLPITTESPWRFSMKSLLILLRVHTAPVSAFGENEILNAQETPGRIIKPGFARSKGRGSKKNRSKSTTVASAQKFVIFRQQEATRHSAGCLSLNNRRRR